jgi:hypothetical protein
MNISLKVEELLYIKLNRMNYLGLNESSLYTFRVKSINIYGESPWSNETSVQTTESILTSDGIEKIFF